VLYRWVTVQVPLTTYLPYLGLTLGIEVPLVLLLLRRTCSWLRSGLAGVMASGITHPLLWFVWPRIVSPYQYVWYVVTGESLVVTIEAMVYFLIVFRPGAVTGSPPEDSPSLARQMLKALGLSLAANAASFAVGMLVHLAQGKL